MNEDQLNDLLQELTAGQTSIVITYSDRIVTIPTDNTYDSVIAEIINCVNNNINNLNQ